MSREINSVAVLGCGTMGAGIAAASAAAGCRVLMLDLTTEAADAAAEQVDEEHRDLVTTGSLDDDLAAIADYDWVCEAIIEDLETKRELFERVEPLRADRSVVSSNTSGIPLSAISEGFDERFRRDVAITHFFNPVRIMKLFELVPGADTDPDVIDAFARFGASRLGKGVVHAKDTVNFIGNRIGCFFMLSGLHRAKPFLADGMSQETIDAVLGQPIGLPPTGLYGLIDLIGLDVMDLVGKNLAVNLPTDDAGRAFTSFPQVEQRMLERGQLGRKTGGGFGRVKRADDGTKTKETFDLISEDWRTAAEPDLEGVPADLGAVIFDDSDQGRLAWEIYGRTLCYAADLVPEIADDPVNIDNAIRWGFNWNLGPFEMLDHLGPARVIERIETEGGPLPAMLAALKAAGADTFYHDNHYLGPDGERHPIAP